MFVVLKENNLYLDDKHDLIIGKVEEEFEIISKRTNSPVGK